MGPAERIVLGLIRAYQRHVSPWKGPTCRFVPTCSEYAAEAVRRHGVVRGLWLALRRLARCHPLGGAGYDPVPGTAGAAAGKGEGSCGERW